LLSEKIVCGPILLDSFLIQLLAVRDNYESEKEDYETKVSELIGVPFKININAGEVWAYASEGSSAGRTFKGYVLPVLLFHLPSYRLSATSRAFVMP
jgi:hypothetical protein